MRYVGNSMWRVFILVFFARRLVVPRTEHESEGTPLFLPGSERWDLEEKLEFGQMDFHKGRTNMKHISLMRNIGFLCAVMYCALFNAEAAVADMDVDVDGLSDCEENDMYYTNPQKFHAG